MGTIDDSRENTVINGERGIRKTKCACSHVMHGGASLRRLVAPSRQWHHFPPNHSVKMCTQHSSIIQAKILYTPCPTCQAYPPPRFDRHRTRTYQKQRTRRMPVNLIISNLQPKEIFDSFSPNITHVLPHFACIGPLKFRELCAPFDLEKHLFAR